MPTSKEIIAAAKKRAVFIEWVDSCGAGHWQNADKVTERLKATTVISVGYVLRDDDEEIVIAMSLDVVTEDVAHVLAIPHVAVVGIWEIDH